MMETDISLRAPTSTVRDLLTAVMPRSGIPFISPLISETIFKFYSLLSSSLMLLYKLSILVSRFVKCSILTISIIVVSFL